MYFFIDPHSTHFEFFRGIGSLPMSFAVAQCGALDLAAREFNEKRVYAGAKRPLDHRSVDASAGTKAARLARSGRWIVGPWTSRLALQDKSAALIAPPPSITAFDTARDGQILCRPLR